MKKKFLVLLVIASLSILAMAIFPNADTGVTATWDGTTFTMSDGTTSTGTRLPAKVTNLVIAEGVKVIPENMAVDRTALVSVSIPASVLRIETNAFARATALVSVEIADDSSLSSIYRRAFYRTAITQISFGDSLTYVGDEAFRLCKSLTSVDLGNGIVGLGDTVFADDSKLQSATIGGTLTTLTANTFLNCTKLNNVELSDSITTLGSNSFRGTTALKSIDLPSNLQVIGIRSFQNSGISSVVMPNSVTKVDNKAFINASNLSSVVFSTNLTTILDYAFSKTKLTSVDFPDTLETIGQFAFYYATELSNVNLSNGITEISKCAFMATAVSNVVLPASVKTIGVYAFKQCSNLTSINLDNVETIKDYAFQSSGFTTLSIPASITSMERGAFSLCENLTSVTFEEGVTDVLGTSTFNACTALTDVQFASTVTNIGATAFYQCSALAEIIIPDGCTTIGAGAFRKTAISVAYIPASVTTMETNIFRDSSAGTVTIRTQDEATAVIAYIDTYSYLTRGENYIPGQEGHVCTFGEWSVTTAPTVDATGLLTRACECGETETYELSALNNTDYAYSVDVEPTCTVAGTAKYIIVVDNQTFEFASTIDATGVHIYGEYVLTTPATPLDKGIETATCECGDTITREINYTGQAVALDVQVNGNVATATLKLVGAPNLTSVGFAITYSDELTATAATTLLTGNTTDPALNNPVKFVWINDAKTNVSVNGDVLTITFTVADDADITVEDFTITYDADDVCYADGDALVNVELETFVKVTVA